jgi:hypothetical protein
MTSDEAAQEAWAEYIKTAYIDPDCILAVRRGFIMGYKVGWSDGYSDADAGG